VLRDPALRARLSAAGLQRAATFSWEACAHRYAELLQLTAGG
jgi:glycosyltransferase involved in cell wall biosynthesis